MPTASLERGVLKPDHVVVRELEGEAILLNLETEAYFGLDEVGTRIWSELVASASVEGVCEVLQQEFDVEPSVLRGDVEKLASELLEQGLLEPEPVDGAVPDEPPGEAANRSESVSRSIS